MILTTQLPISADFRPQATGHRPQATGNYGAEFGFVKCLTHKFIPFLFLFSLRDDTTVDDFSPCILAEGKSVPELDKSNTNLGKFDLDGGNSSMELGKSASNGGNPNMKLGNFTVNEGNSGMEFGKSTANGSNFTSDGGNPVPYRNKEKP
jgi:hypothetical protein